MSRLVFLPGRAKRRSVQQAVFVLCLALGIAVPTLCHGAEPMKVGLLMVVTSGPVMIAKEKGYFAAEGFDAELVPFDAGQPVAVAAVAGAIDFGVAGVTSALYTLAAQGALRVIAGSNEDRPGFPAAGLVVSNHAYDEGLRSLKDLAGHSVGLTQIGSTYHYAFALVAAKYGIDLASMRLLPLQAFSNLAAAVKGGQDDVAVLTKTAAQPMLEHGDAKLLAWVADEATWQVGAVWTSTKTLEQHRDRAERFLRALRRGAQDYAAAFVAKDGTRADGPTAPAILAILQKYIDQPPAQMAGAIGYTDPDLRLDVTDVQRQLAWYRSQGMLKTDITIDQVIDRKLVVPLPAQ
jgi:NitT/TauT family transport system substrate-binding protein